MVYDSRTDRVVMLLSLYLSLSWFVWSYDYTNDTWTNVSAAGAPPPRFDASIAYDPSADRVLVFGGARPDLYPPGAARSTNETWIYDPTNGSWTNLSRFPSPPGRAAAGMVYDDRSDRAILFGGRLERVGLLGLYNDTWTFCYACAVGSSNRIGSPTDLALPAVAGSILFGVLIVATYAGEKKR